MFSQIFCKNIKYNMIPFVGWLCGIRAIEFAAAVVCFCIFFRSPFNSNLSSHETNSFRETKATTNISRITKNPRLSNTGMPSLCQWSEYFDSRWLFHWMLYLLRFICPNSKPNRTYFHAFDFCHVSLKFHFEFILITKSNRIVFRTIVFPFQFVLIVNSNWNVDSISI